MRRDADWNTYDYRYEPPDGSGPRTATVRFDVGCAVMPTPDHHGTSLRVMVDQGDAAQLDEILWRVSDAAWWVGEERFRGLYVAVLQVTDAEAVEAEIDGHRGELRVRFQRSAGWDYFADRVCPSEHAWRRITDREQLERLGGIDHDVPRPVRHAFYGAPSGLASLRERLLAEGFEAPDTPSDRLVVVKEHTLASVSDISVPLMRLAAQHGCAYDGWSP